MKATSHEVARLVDAVPLTDLLAVTYGPIPALSAALSAVPGVEQAYIYASWAAAHTYASS